MWLYVMDEKIVMCVWWLLLRVRDDEHAYLCECNDEEGCDAPPCVCICVCHDRNDELPMFSPKCRFISISVNFPALSGPKISKGHAEFFREIFCF